MILARNLSPPRRGALLAVGVGAVLALGACGQRGVLYMPDRNARVVTRPAASAPSSAPSSAPAAEPR